MSHPTFDDFTRMLANDPSLPAPEARAWLDSIRKSDRYDLGQLLSDIEHWPYLRDLRRENSDADGNADIRFGVNDPNMLIRWERGDITIFVHWVVAEAKMFFWLHQDDRWVMSRDQPWDTWNKVMTSTEFALLLIQEAEANNAENVEFVDRDVLSPHGTPARQRFNNKRVRTISLTQTRKQYLGGAKPHQGGTHARPVEHIRILTERTITPKGRKPYVRKAKVITINPGVRRETRVTL